MKKLTIEYEDDENELEELIQSIERIGNQGHGFEIILDPEMKAENDEDGIKTEFYWDGDGVNRIIDIAVEELKEEFIHKIDIRGNSILKENNQEKFPAQEFSQKYGVNVYTKWKLPEGFDEQSVAPNIREKNAVQAFKLYNTFCELNPILKQINAIGIPGKWDLCMGVISRFNFDDIKWFVEKGPNDFENYYNDSWRLKLNKWEQYYKLKVNWVPSPKTADFISKALQLKTPEELWNKLKKTNEAKESLAKKILRESIILPVKIGDEIKTGKFLNKRTKVKKISKDEHGMPTINGKSITRIRIPKIDPKESIVYKILREAFTIYPVKSSNIKTIGYDPQLKILRVEFLSGTTYDYFKVPKDIFQLMKKTKSKGHFLNMFIKGKYKYKQI